MGGGRRCRRRADRAGGGRPRAPPARASRRRRTTSRRRSRPALDHRYDGDFAVLRRRRRRRRSTATTTGCPTCTSPAASGPAALFANESPVGGALRFDARSASPATDLDAVTGAYPLDVDGDGITDLAVLRVGESVLLRGLGDCRFERANERWALDGGDGWTTAFSATWEGATTLPTLAFGRYLTLDAQRRRDLRRAPTNELVRPAAGGHRLRRADRRSARAAARCRCCSATGTAPAGATCGSRNDRHYYRRERRRGAALADRARRAPRALHAPPTAGSTLQIWGMGIASQDLTGDGYPEIYLTSQGDNKLQTLADGPSQPTYGDIALAARRDRRPRRSPAATRCRRPPGTPSSRTSTTTACSDLFVTKGNVEAEADYAPRRTRATCSWASRTGRSVEVRGGGRDPDVRPRPRRRARRPQPRRAARPRRGRRGATRSKLWRNVGRGTRDAAAPMGHWLGAAARPARRRTATRSARGSRSKVGDRTVRARGDGRRRPRERPARLDPRRAGRGRRRARSGSRGRTARWARGCPSTANRLRHDRSGRRPGEPVVDAVEATAMTAPTRTARLADVDLPDFGMPAAIAGAARRRCYADRLERLRERMAAARLRPPRRLRRPRAQREPLVPDRLRPAVRGGDPHRRRDRRRRRSSSATSAGARPARRPCRCAASCSRTSACRASRATGRGRSPRSSRDEGIGAGRRVGVVGWKTYARPSDDRRAGVPRRRAARRWSARRARSRTRPTC